MQHRSWGFILGILLVLGTAGAAGFAQPLKPQISGTSLRVPTWSLLGECHPIDFRGIDVEWHPGRRVHQLTVTGTKPYTNMEVSLSHESYRGRPEFWRTMVVGCVKNGLVLPIPSPYYVTMTLDRFVGSRGVEIVGASRSVRRAVH